MNQTEGPPSGGDLNRGPDLLGASFSTVIVVLITIFLRLIGRVFVLRRFGWDDAVILLATVSKPCAFRLAGANLTKIIAAS